LLARFIALHALRYKLEQLALASLLLNYAENLRRKPRAGILRSL